MYRCTVIYLKLADRHYRLLPRSRGSQESSVWTLLTAATLRTQKFGTVELHQNYTYPPKLALDYPLERGWIPVASHPTMLAVPFPPFRSSFSDVRYAEHARLVRVLRYCPSLHRAQGLTNDEIVAAVVRGQQRCA